VRHKPIDGDLGPLPPARRLVLLKVSFIPVQRVKTYRVPVPAVSIVTLAGMSSQTAGR
jgi:hypothetical protein